METTVLATRGVGGYRQYRIPALAVTLTGRLVAVYDARLTFDDLPGPVDLVMRTSDDHGRSWSAQTPLRRSAGIAGTGDASVTVDAATGRIVVLYSATESVGFFESRPGCGADDADVAHVAMSWSDDDGETWQWRLVTCEVKPADADGVFPASGTGASILGGRHAGRLVQPLVVRKGWDLYAAVAFSDDAGDHWSVGECVGPGFNESGLVSLDDGRLLLVTRATPWRRSVVSADGGATFGPPRTQRDLPDPGDNGDVARSDGRPVLSFAGAGPAELLLSNNHDTDIRRNLVVSVSDDDGASWRQRYLIDPGSVGYSTVTRLADGAIGVLYERGGYTDIVFARFEEDDAAVMPPVGGPGPAIPATAQEAAVLRRADPMEFTVALRLVSPAVRHPEAAPDIRTRPVGDWDRTVAAEVSGGPGDGLGRRIVPREYVDRVYGPVEPGLHAGDELRFVARLRHRGGVPVAGLSVVVGEADGRGGAGAAGRAGGSAVDLEALPQGGVLAVGLRREVTEADVASGEVVVAVTASAVIAGEPWRRTDVRRFAVDTGRLRGDADG